MVQALKELKGGNVPGCSDVSLGLIFVNGSMELSDCCVFQSCA